MPQLVGVGRLLRSARATTALTTINGTPIATSDIIAWLDAAPASGPILIPDLVAAGWSNPSGGYEQGNSGVGTRAYEDLDAGEIAPVGARRIDHANATDYGFGAAGIQWLPTEADGSTQISGIDGIQVRGTATNQVTKADGTSVWTSSNATLVTGLSLGVLNGFSLESTATSGRHIGIQSASTTNPHRMAGSCVYRRENSEQFIQFNNQSGHINFDLNSLSVSGSSGMEGYVIQLAQDLFFAEFRTTADRSNSLSYFIPCLITSGTAPKDEVHTTAGLKFSFFGATHIVGPGGTTLPFPGIINNNTGATLLRQAMTPTIAKSAADLGTLGPELVTNGGFDADSDWVKPSDWSIAGGVASADGTGANSLLDQVRSFTSGVLYEVTFTVVSRVSGSVRSRLGNSAFGSSRSAPGTYADHLVSDGNGHIYLQSFSFNGSIDNVSVREVIPNHAFMISWKQPAIWPGAGKGVLVGNNGEILLETTATAGQLRTVVGGFSETWPAGSTTAGAINRIAVSTDATGALRASVNGGAVQTSAQTTYAPSFASLAHGYNPSTGQYFQAAIQQEFLGAREFTDAELQGMSS